MESRIANLLTALYLAQWALLVAPEDLVAGAEPVAGAEVVAEVASSHPAAPKGIIGASMNSDGHIGSYETGIRSA